MPKERILIHKEQTLFYPSLLEILQPTVEQEEKQKNKTGIEAQDWLA